MIAAVLDACVLYSAPLRDFWMHLKTQNVFQPKWTARIQDEWIRNVLTNRPDLNPEHIARTRALMERWGGDWRLPDYTSWLSQVSLPDPDDVHVVAAAIAGGISTIVTFNLSDFPEIALSAYGIRAIHPDVFACELLDANLSAFLTAAKTHRTTLKKPPKNVESYLETLTRGGLTQTAARLGAYAVEL